MNKISKIFINLIIKWGIFGTSSKKKQSLRVLNNSESTSLVDDREDTKLKKKRK